MNASNILRLAGAAPQRSLIIIYGNIQSLGRHSGKTENLNIYKRIYITQMAQNIQVLARKIASCTIMPMIDTNSHKEMYLALELCRKCGMTEAEMYDGCLTWLESPKWKLLKDIEYIYMCRDFCENIGDINKYFRTCGYGTIVKSTLSLLKSLGKIDAYMKCINYFSTLDFETCFESSDPRTVKLLHALKFARASDDIFMLNCHDEFFATYLRRVPNIITADTHWKCEGITRQVQPENGAPVMAGFADAKTRLNEFANNIFTARDGSFPAENVVISGGSVMKVLNPIYSTKENIHSDVDIFIYGPNSAIRAAAYERIITWFAGPGTYYSVIGSVTTVYQMDVRRKFQIISANHNTAYCVIKNFDFTHVQFCYDIKSARFFGTANAFEAIRTGISCLENISNLKTVRFIKTLYNGFNIKRNPEIEKILDITALINNPTEPHLKKIIRDFHGWYYPTSAELEYMDAEDFECRVIRMIEKDSNSTIVTTNIDIAFKHMVIGGNFNSSYESNHYSTFNQLALTNNFGQMKTHIVKLQSKYGPMKFNTCTFTCTKIEKDINIDGIIITLHCDESFIQFVKNIGDNIFRLFRGRCAKELPINGNDVEFEIPERKIIAQSDTSSIMRDQRNIALDIEEDLRIGDHISINFSVELWLNHELLILEVNKITKYCEVSMNNCIVIKDLSFGGSVIKY